MEQPEARRRLSAVERREQILDVTQAIVDVEGFHAATPTRIAEEAGVTRPVLYQQFGDIGSVFVALIDREQARAGTQFSAAIAGSQDSPEAVIPAEQFEAVLTAIDEHPATWRLFLVPPEGAPPVLHERLAESEAAVLAYFQAGLDQRYPDLPDPEYVARILHAAARELLRLRLTNPEHATNERLGALVRDLSARVLGTNS